MQIISRTPAQEARVFFDLWGKKEAKAELGIIKEHAGWFDFRSMTPVKRTEEFAWIFTKVTRDFIRRYLDDATPTVRNNGSVADWNPIKSGDIFKEPELADGKKLAAYHRKIGSLIRARQWCDSMGIPYDIAIKHALKLFYFDKSYLRTKRTLPDPSLMNGAEVRNAIVLHWVDILDSQIQVSKKPEFVVSNEPTKDQLDHEKWILDQLEKRGAHEFTIRTMVTKGLVRRSAAEDRFGKDKVRL